MPLISNFRYRPEVDGLRAVAVVAVLLYHAGFGCEGGYVGVDVFFVISGYLITSLIWKDLESGRFTFAHFWERRARRIVPALVVVTVATLAAGWFLLLPEDFGSLGRAVAAQAVFGANIHYWFDSGYFAGAAEEKPLLHTWSLAVEEQFYLFVPFLMWGMFRTAALRGRAAVISILSAGFIFSFALSVYGVIRAPSATFYLLPTRAWELLLGALVAFLPPSLPPLGRRWARELFALAGLILVLIPVLAYTPKTPFPGLAALPPCLGTALIIWANERGDRKIPTAVGTALSVRPVVFIGLISYSLYLWHWPFLAFSRYVAFAPLTAGYRAAMIGLGLLSAVLSWKYVETPFRERKLGASRKSVFAFAGTGLVVVLCAGLLCVAMRGFPQRFPEEAQKLASAKSDMAFINELTADDVRAGKLVPVGVADSTLRPAVLVWGDSHAMSALPAVDAFLKERGLAGRAATHSATAPVLNWFIISNSGLGSDAPAFNDAVLSYVRSRQIPDVMLIANWHAYAGSGGASSESFNASLLATVRQLVAAGSRPWILLTVPAKPYDVPRVLSRSVISHSDTPSLYTKPAEEYRFDLIPPQTIAEVEAAGGRVLDPKPRFLDQAGRQYVVQADGVVLYRDSHHLTTKGAILMLVPLLREELTLGK
jgi:peptidoglycan/LPS O-acetylase OafA/YrhL